MRIETVCMDVDSFQMPMKCPTSGGQAHDQETVVQEAFHLVRSSFVIFQH